MPSRVLAGFDGAPVGGLLTSLLGFRSEGEMIYTILVAVLGAALLTWLYRKMTRARA